jgi:hypothetical protein
VFGEGDGFVSFGGYSRFFRVVKKLTFDRWRDFKAPRTTLRKVGEILLKIAMLVSKFEFEFVEWVGLDGEKSERPPKNDTRHEGAGAMPSHVDMKVRMKRIW